MFTDTFQNNSPTLDQIAAMPNLSLYPKSHFTSVVNPETSYLLYERYRVLALGLIDLDNPEIFYRTFYNEQDSYNGEGIHEKFIYQGQAILDLSVGLLDFPWFAADGNPYNEITALQLQQLANTEQSIIVAPRLRAMATFVALLPPYTRIYHYSGLDGVRSLTLNDEFNGVKLNCILSYNAVHTLF